MKNGKMIFFGTSEICIPFLQNLNNNFDLKLIVSPPDALGGRNRKKVIVPAVKTFALDNNIDVIQPEKLRSPDTIEKIKAINPDIGVVIAYGKLIPASVFRLPKHRMINVHFSMLPLYRGAAPVQRGLQNGDSHTGISIFELVKKMDAGPIWAQKQFPIAPTDTTASLWEKLSIEGAGFLEETLINILDNKIQKNPQDENNVSYAPPVQKQEGKIDWNLSAQQIVDKFRAFTPWPGIYCDTGDKRFKFTKINVAPDSHDKTPGKAPGDVLSMDKNNLKICCSNNSVLAVTELQPQGKKPMPPHAYCRGNELPVHLA
ncbi:MAG: methionyl-tRNA formyltransferase [bacterium]|nr:methionyl-tRNA formyltransferase [bacterium]